MANKRKVKYVSPPQEEFIFDCLTRYPEWAKSKLLPSEQSIFKTHNTIRQFVTNATSDEKQVLLAKGGFNSATVYWNRDKNPALILENVARAYRSTSAAKERAKLIQALKDEEMFVITSREILSYLSLLAQNTHTPYYAINYNYKRTYTAAEKFKYQNINFQETSTAGEVKEQEQYRNHVAKLVLETLRADHYVRNVQKLDMVDVKIMLFLFIYRDTFVEREAIFRELFDYKSNSISNKLMKLVRDNYIDVNRSNKNRPSFTIAEMGIMTVSDLLERLTDKSLII